MPAMRTAFPFYLPDRQPAPPSGIPVPQYIVDSFLNRLRRLPSNRSLNLCWRIDGRSDPLGAYVQFKFRAADLWGISIRAHRLSYLYFNGPIPDGLHVLHACHCKGCVNPSHIYAGTDRENGADRMDWERAEAEAGRVTKSARHWNRMREAAAQRRALRCDAMAA